jgi:hypothetical protein
MSKYYSIILEEGKRWISMPYNGGELGPCPVEIMQELNRLIHQRDEANERIKRLEEAGDKMAYNHNPFTFLDWQKARESKPSNPNTTIE